jgi:hypothetical protein
MSNFTQIEIDIEVYKAIENSRRSFSETHNDVLRRIIGLDGSKNGADEQSIAPEIHTFKSWRGKGVELPHGTLVRMEHNGRVYSGEILDGMWSIEGVLATTPSGAASAVARTKQGGSAPLNGWNYWEARLPSSNRWKPIASLRK